MLATNVDGISRAGGRGKTPGSVPEVEAAIFTGSRSLASLSAEDMVTTVEMEGKARGGRSGEGGLYCGGGLVPHAG